VTYYPREVKDLGGLFTINFAAMDHWFEEEEEIFVHPKDPYKVSGQFPLVCVRD
jgi:hypothetical protein